MISTPIFDETLADAPVNIWQASSIFPQPLRMERLTRDDYMEYRVRHVITPPIDPANLSFLRSVA